MNNLLELVSLLRDQADQSGLKRYQEAYQTAMAAMTRVTAQTTTAVQSLRINLQPQATRPRETMASLGEPAQWPVQRRAGVGERAMQLYTPVALTVSAGMNRARQALANSPPGQPAAAERVVAVEERQGLTRRGFDFFNATLTQRILAEADAWARMDVRLRQATDSAEQYADVNEQLGRISRQTQQAQTSNAEVYVSTWRAMQDMGKSAQDTIKLVESLSISMELSGVSAQGRAAASAVFSQAMQSGRVNLEQYQTLTQAAPRLETAWAAGMNRKPEQLREMASAGTLTTAMLVPAMTSQLGVMQAELTALPPRILGAWAVLGDAFSRFLSTTGKPVLQALSGLILALADNIETVVAVISAAGVFWGLPLLGAALLQTARHAVSLGQAWGSAVRAGARFLPLIGILTAIYLVGQDIADWLAGSPSAMAQLIGPASEWQGSIEAVKSAFAAVKDVVIAVGREYGPLILQIGTMTVMAGGLWQAFSPFVALVADLAQNLVPMLWRAFSASPIVGIITLAALTLWALWANWDAIVQFFVESWDWIRSAAQGTMFEPLIGYIQAIWDFWSKIFKGVIAAFTGDWDGALKLWKAGFTAIGEYFSGIGADMIALVKDIGSSIQTWIGDKITDAKKRFFDLFTWWRKEEPKALAAAPAVKAIIPDPAASNPLAVPVVPPASLPGMGLRQGERAFAQANHFNINIDAPGADPRTLRQSVTDGVTRGLDLGYRPVEFLSLPRSPEAG